jgi:HD-like signal output (HDOD) protein
MACETAKPDWQTLRNSILAENSDSVLPPSVKLPVLPKALADFRSKAEDPDADTGELSRIIASDAGLSAELLRIVNSCNSGVRVNVTSVKQALIHLGIKTTLLHLTTSALKQSMKSSASKLVNFRNFWNTNLERALLAREIATLLGADADVAFTGGMLQDVLLPLITNQLFDDYLEFTSNRDGNETLVAFEQRKFKWDHAQAAAQVMYSWGFPDELVCCIYFHHDVVKILGDESLSKTSAAAVAISTWMPDALRQEPDGLDALMELEKKWDRFNLLPIAEKVNDELLEISTDARSHFTLLRFYKNAIKRKQAN